MYTIYDYVRFRNDIDLNYRVINELDSLIFTQLCYLDMDNILDNKKSKKLDLIVDEYIVKNEVRQLTEAKNMMLDVAKLIRIVRNSKRYGDLVFTNYVNKIDNIIHLQFSAVTIELPNNEAYIAYRGTDVSMVGWREDLNMLFMEHIPSQIEALNYIDSIKKNYDKIYIGGHSKGGNLAIFSGINCCKDIYNKVVRIDNFDGPGFNSELICEDRYKDRLNRINNYLPENAIIGRLFNQLSEYSIINSNNRGIWQHNPFSWEVSDLKLKRLKHFNKKSDKLNNAIENIIKNLNDIEKKEFVISVFEVLEKAGVNNINDIASFNLVKIMEIMRAFIDISEDKRSRLISVFSQLFS